MPAILLLLLTGDCSQACPSPRCSPPLPRSHFVKLAAPDEQLAAKSLRELEAHSQVCPGAGGQHALHEGRGACAARSRPERAARLAGRCRAQDTAPLTPSLPLPLPAPQVMDLLGYEHASPENKINIHIGGELG